MCDTVVATGDVTADGVTVFGKNSDREPNEAHHLIEVPAQDHPEGSRVHMTYIDIPQVSHTYAILLARPFWIWGAEMGANEHGVVIGNEAVFTRVPYEKGAGMIGMDLLRLGLERSRTAREAVEVMAALLETHGQGGNCGFRHPFYYHNSFLAADAGEAWVFETAGRQWAARQVRGVYTISNGITLHNEWDMASADLVRYAVDRGWCKGRDDFDFARCYSDTINTTFSNCRGRCQRTSYLLEAQRGKIDVRTVMAVLRDHGVDGGQSFQPEQRGLTGIDVCMHAGYGPVRINQSVGSMASHLHPQHPTHFFTATSAPCTSIFKPVWLDTGIPEHGPQPAGEYDEHSLFWRHEHLHRRTLEDYRSHIGVVEAEREAVEQKWVAQALANAGSGPAARRKISEQAFTEAEQALHRKLKHVESRPAGGGGGFLHRSAWRRFNREAKMPGSE